MRPASENGRGSPQSGGGGVLLWVVVLSGSLALSVLLWAGGGYLWSHPETKLGYTVLQKIGKIEPLKRFEAWEAPLGRFHTASAFFAAFSPLPDAALRERSNAMLRSYIRNYHKERDPVTYLYGRFVILDVEKVGPRRFVPGGVVILARAEETSQVLIEYVLPATEEQTEAAMALLRPGMLITLQKSNDLGAVIRVTRAPDKRLIATVINLLYGEFDLDSRPGSGFACEPPARLEPETGWPVFSRMKEVLARLGPPEPVRVADNTAPVTPPSALARRDNAGPRESAAATIASAPARSATAPPQGAATTPEARTEALRIEDDATPAASPSEIISSSVVETVPAAEAGPEVATAGAPSPAPSAWPLYAGGEAPPARIVEPGQLSELARAGLTGETLYLGGEFVVSAVGGGSAILRARDSQITRPGSPPLQPFFQQTPAASDVRIIAEFPPGARMPRRGETLVRDRRRPFEITGISSEADGSLNVRVREITVP